MKQAKIVSALGLLVLADLANAGVSSTITVVSDYDYRGYSQTTTDPALQVSLDYVHESGFYVGAWATNVDFGRGSDADIEIDTYAGFTGKINDSATWDVGLLRYNYPGEGGLNFLEVYGGVTVGWFKAKLSYSDDFAGTDEDGIYLDTNATIPLPANFSILAHVGYSTGDAIEIVTGDEDNYVDYNLGVGYTAGNFNFALKWYGSTADEIKADLFNNEDRVIFSVSTTLPWK